MDIQFVKPDITEAEIEAVIKVLRSGWLTTGPVTKQFEREFASYLGTPRAACMSSQTIGAEFILRMLGVGEGDEVILPAYTYSASCSVVYHVGATPVLIDSQKNSPEMDYDAMETSITEKTKIIIPVDIGGVVCDYDRIYEAVERKRSLYRAGNNQYQKEFGRIIVLADTAHSLGASSNSIKAGNLADFSSFSFHAVKNLTTGEGGAITWKDSPYIDHDTMYRNFMLLSLHGQTKDALDKTASASWEYDIIEPWYKSNLTDVASAIGLSQLQRYQAMLDRRHEVVRKYDQGFSVLPVSWLNHYKEGQHSSAHLYFLKLTDRTEKERNIFIESLQEKGISCNVHYKPLPMLSAYKKRGFNMAKFPNAYKYYENLVTLPLYNLLSDMEVDYIISSVCDILSNQ